MQHSSACRHAFQRQTRPLGKASLQPEMLRQGVCLSAINPDQAEKLCGRCRSLLVPQLAEFSAWFHDAFTLVDEPRKYTEDEVAQVSFNPQDMPMKQKHTLREHAATLHVSTAANFVLSVYGGVHGITFDSISYVSLELVA